MVHLKSEVSFLIFLSGWSTCWWECGIEVNYYYCYYYYYYWSFSIPLCPVVFSFNESSPETFSACKCHSVFLGELFSSVWFSDPLCLFLILLAYVCFVEYEYSHSYLHLDSIYMNIIFHPFSLCVFACDVSSLQRGNSCVLFCSSIRQYIF
jgi:hypothetical protein